MQNLLRVSNEMSFEILLFKMTNNASGAGMGTAGLVGQFMTWETMSSTETHFVLIIKILL